MHILFTQTFATFFSELRDIVSGRNWTHDLNFLRSIVVMAVALALVLFVIRLGNRFLPKIAELITDQAAVRAHGDKLLAVKRTETVLNVIAAVGKALLVVVSLYFAWRLANPGSAPLAIIGASTVFFIVGVATVGPLLRDITSGILMISERWYEVGDHIVVDPFWEMSGVVEQINLRSTKIRSLDGEIVWIHNQHIQGVRVTPRGLRTISIDIFVKDRDKGQRLLEEVIPTLPTGSSFIATPLTITGEEHLGDLWRITATGQTTPGREWLIEDFAVKAITKIDAEHKDKPVMVYDPVTRYADQAAERRFLRSIRGRSDQKHNKRHRNVTKVEEV